MEIDDVVNAYRLGILTLEMACDMLCEEHDASWTGCLGILQIHSHEDRRRWRAWRERKVQEKREAGDWDYLLPSDPN